MLFHCAARTTSAEKDVNIGREVDVKKLVAELERAHKGAILTKYVCGSNPPQDHSFWRDWEAGGFTLCFVDSQGRGVRTESTVDQLLHSAMYRCMAKRCEHVVIVKCLQSLRPQELPLPYMRITDAAAGSAAIFRFLLL